MHLFRFVIALSALVFASDARGRTNDSPDFGQPNIVIVIADDCTFHDIGCYGGQANTPNIDRIASQGMKFKNCFQAAPMCSPTRHNLYTGLYPVKSGAYPNHTFVRPGTKSIASYLKQKGYRVALSGKQHIGPKNSFPFEFSGKKNPDLEKVDQLFKECRQSKTPFCLIACSNEPHTPWDKGDPSQYPVDKIKLPPYLVDTPKVREAFARYLAEISYFDWQVGEITKRLENHQLVKNTIFIVLSEQGNSLPFAKWTCYGNGLQSAMLVRWPNQVKPGTSADAMVEYVDILPTLLKAVSANALPGGLDGKSFLNILLADKQNERRRHKQFSYGIMTTRGIINGSDLYGSRTVRDSRYRLIWNLNHDVKFTNACTQSSEFRSMREAAKSDVKLTALLDRYQHRPQYELYDTQADPFEMNNLIDEKQLQTKVDSLKKKLEQWMDQQGDKGVETERDAILHQGKYRKLSPEEAFAKYEKSRKKKQKK